MKYKTRNNAHFLNDRELITFPSISGFSIQTSDVFLIIYSKWFLDQRKITKYENKCLKTVARAGTSEKNF